MYLQELGEGGKPAFYEGRVAQAIVDVTSQHGGVMTLNDLCSHESEIIRPISTDYKVSLYTCLMYFHFSEFIRGRNDSNVCSGCVSVGAPT